MDRSERVCHVCGIDFKYPSKLLVTYNQLSILLLRQIYKLRPAVKPVIMYVRVRGYFL